VRRWPAQREDDGCGAYRQKEQREWQAAALSERGSYTHVNTTPGHRRPRENDGAVRGDRVADRWVPRVSYLSHFQKFLKTNFSAGKIDRK
jgi:hypothetical protein